MWATIFSILFAIWAADGAVLLALTFWMFRRLREKHALTYETIGSPTLFWNNSPRNQWLLVKFIFGTQWQELDDSAVARVCRFMRVFLIFYVAGFLAIVVMMLIFAFAR
jgi:hypothetical protein